jgi:hypothetical protein
MSHLLREHAPITLAGLTAVERAPKTSPRP